MTIQKHVLPALLTAGLLMGACAAGPEPRENPIPVQAPPAAAVESQGPLALYSRELRIPLWETVPPELESEKAPALGLKLDLIYPRQAGGSPEEQALDLLFRRTFYQGQAVQDYAGELIRLQTLEYRDMGEEAKNYPNMINSGTLNWSYEESFEVELITARLLIISRSRSHYAGGAHGNYDKTYFIFDREVSMLLTLSDLIRAERRPAVQDLVNRELLNSKQLRAGDSLKAAGYLVDRAELTDNIFLSPQGLGFHWDPYEIAPYAEGYVEVTVPLEELRSFLSPEGLRMFRELE
ncbi:MAG: DUF3298 and DUF4163 domain-containing protein [Treponema sp.]|jgi:hypothetical protein|nr:DUF3298 and DUF4163 domain-containing protein [Treponema sp.]